MQIVTWRPGSGDEAGSFSLATLNTGDGLEYHPFMVELYHGVEELEGENNFKAVGDGGEPRVHKVKRLLALTVTSIPADRMLNRALLWALLAPNHERGTCHTAKNHYEVVLPLFAGKVSRLHARCVLRAVLMHMLVCQPLCDIQADNKAVSRKSDYITPQRAGMCFYRGMLSGVRYVSRTLWHARACSCAHALHCRWCHCATDSCCATKDSRPRK